jgi:hypothetical protein
MNARPTVKIELTPEQQAEIRRVTGQEVPAVQLAVEAIEERVLPALTLN